MPELLMPSRRAVVRTAAWAVPAVSAVAAAPAYAAASNCVAIAPTAMDLYPNDLPGFAVKYQLTVTSGSIPAGATMTVVLTGPEAANVTTDDPYANSSNLSYTGDVEKPAPATFAYTVNTTVAAGNSLWVGYTVTDDWWVATQSSAVITVSNLGAGCGPLKFCGQHSPNPANPSAATYSLVAC